MSNIKRHKVIEFKLDDAKLNEERRADLFQMVNTQGWVFFKQTVESNIGYVEEMILNNINRKGQQMNEHEVNVLREAREFMIDLIELPENLAGQLLKMTGEMPTESPDPYAKSIDEIKN